MPPLKMFTKRIKPKKTFMRPDAKFINIANIANNLLT